MESRTQERRSVHTSQRATSAGDASVDTEGDEPTSIPLCVDLDGTLLRTDLLYESTLAMLKQDPATVLRLPGWTLRGRAYLKREIARRVDMRDYRFPVNESVLEFVRRERGQRRTLLVTGSDQSLANLVAAQTDAFDECHGSDGETNLTGVAKRRWLVARFGEKGFDYIGNDRADVAVWKSSRHALAVARADAPPGGSGTRFERVFRDRPLGGREWFKLMRVHQWSKNALIAVPFLLDQRFTDPVALTAVVLAFLAMSLLASATYIVNDMLDLQADRRNETKRARMLASGRVSLEFGLIAVAALAGAALTLTLFLPSAFTFVLALYLVLTLAYSFRLKQIALVDVGMVAGLHTLRVIGGTVAIGAAWSFWLLAFSIFFFFSLALAKRVAELINLKAAGRSATVGRDYRVEDIPVLLASGVSTGYLSVAVVALYINSAKVRLNYAEPMALWFVCPLLMYWIGRIWIKTSRGQMHEDPIVFALRDRTSALVLALLAVSVFAAMVL